MAVSIAIPAHMRVDLGTVDFTDLKSIAKSITEIDELEQKKASDFFPLPVLQYQDKQILISQSMMKDYKKLAMSEYCPKQFVHTWFLHETTKDWDTQSMKMGRRFEYELTGGLDRDGSIPAQVLTEKTRKVSVDQKRISKNAELIKSAMKDLGFDLENGKAGVKLSVDGLTGTLDYMTTLGGIEVIVDIKYSGLIDNCFNELGWNDDEQARNYIANNHFHVTQAIHYTLLVERKTGRTLPFVFLIADNRAEKEGQYKAFQIDISETAKVKHLQRIHVLIRQLQQRIEQDDLKPEPIYSRCKSCLVQDCDSRQTFEPITSVIIE